VLNFATTLRNRGIDAILDQWDLKPGNDLAHFMETELSNSDFVVMVCTEQYVEKANTGKGGVGYEKMIMTSSLLQKIDNSKVIPIIRQISKVGVPTFLSSKLYIDFSNDKDEEYNLDELLRTLLNAPLFEKPKIGNNPFTPLKQSKPDRTSDGLKEVMRIIAEAFNNSTDEVIYLREILPYSKMHRLTFNKYLLQAIRDELIEKDSIKRYVVTEKGLEYLVLHEIIQA